MDLCNKVHKFEPVKVHTYELNISLNSLISLMFNYAKPRLDPATGHPLAAIITN